MAELAKDSGRVKRKSYSPPLRVIRGWRYWLCRPSKILVNESAVTACNGITRSSLGKIGGDFGDVYPRLITPNTYGPDAPAR
jgi:hypothetical protein